IPADISNSIAAADAFVAEASRHLSPQPQPHRHHPYWTGGMAMQRKMARQTPLKSPANAGEVRAPRSFLDFLWRLRLASFGPPPNLRPWHPRWPDFRLPADALKRRFREEKAQVLLVSGAPETLRVWKPTANCEITTIASERLLMGRTGATLLE